MRLRRHQQRLLVAPVARGQGGAEGSTRNAELLVNDGVDESTQVDVARRPPRTLKAI